MCKVCLTLPSSILFYWFKIEKYKHLVYTKEWQVSPFDTGRFTSLARPEHTLGEALLINLWDNVQASQIEGFVGACEKQGMCNWKGSQHKLSESTIGFSHNQIGSQV